MMINLNICILKELSKYRKINLLLINNNPKKQKSKKDSDRSIPQVFILCLKRNVSQTFKSIATTENFFSKRIGLKE